MRRIKLENILIPFGMVGTLLFLAYTIVGASQLPEVGTRLTGVAVVTAEGSVGAGSLRVLAYAFGVCMFAFSAGMLMRAYRAYNKSLLVAYIVFLNLQIMFVIGFALFPFQGTYIATGGMNLVHGILAVLVAIAINVFAFLTGFGYHKQEKRNRLGRHCTVWALLIMVISIMNIILISLDIGFFGVGERAVVLALLGLVFHISYTETFTKTAYNRT